MLDDHKQFIADMRDAGHEVFLYNGRFFYRGPAVSVEDISDAMAITSIACGYDSLGLGYVVHPKVADRNLTEQDLEEF